MSVCWMDGGQPQLESILDAKIMSKMAELKIIMNKHFAVRTRVEQPYDLCPVFRSFKAFCLEVTKSDMPPYDLFINID